ncbi:hypothetical protein BKA81DRAFT_403449 [Phyllosticta paracitricarpa]
MSTCVGYLVAMWFPKYNDNGIIDMSPLVDHTPITLSAAAQLEYAARDASGRLVGVVIKKRVLSVLKGAGAEQTIGRRGALNLGKKGLLRSFGLLGRGMSRRKALLS